MPKPRVGKAPAPSLQKSKLVSLEGRVPRELRFELDHDTYCQRVGKCTCSVVQVGTVETSKIDGSTSAVFKQKRVPGVISVRYRKKTQVEEVALSLPVLAAAISSRKIRLHR